MLQCAFPLLGTMMVSARSNRSASWPNISAFLLLVVSCASIFVAAQADDTPEIGITTTFPGNDFSIIKNGEANRVVFSISNPPSADRVLDLEGITGAFLNPKKEDGQRGRVLRNLTTTRIKSLPLRMVGGRPVQLPYDVHAEFKPQNLDLELRLLVRDQQTPKTHNILAYKGSVTVVEPKRNWFDLQILSVYALMVAGVGAGLYFLYESFTDGTRKGKTARKQVPSATAASVAAKKPAAKSTASSELDTDWIPEQHLRSRKGAASPVKGKSR